MYNNLVIIKIDKNIRNEPFFIITCHTVERIYEVKEKQLSVVAKQYITVQEVKFLLTYPMGMIVLIFQTWFFMNI